MYASENLRNDKWVSVWWCSKIILLKAFPIAGGKRFQRFLLALLREKKSHWISSDALCCHDQSLCIYIHALTRLHSRHDCIQGWSFDQVIHSHPWPCHQDTMIIQEICLPSMHSSSMNYKIKSTVNTFYHMLKTMIYINEISLDPPFCSPSAIIHSNSACTDWLYSRNLHCLFSCLCGSDPALCLTDSLPTSNTWHWQNTQCVSHQRWGWWCHYSHKPTHTHQSIIDIKSASRLT